jgi:DNA uptake protein ComE-like DNA-binding protein
MFGRDSGENGGEEKRLTPEGAASERGRVGRFAAWLGFGPEEEGVQPQKEGVVQPEEAEPESEWPPSPRRAVPASEADLGRPGEDAEERIRGAAARAAEQAEQRATQEILALEEDLERARQETAQGVAELESRLAQMEDRAIEAERRAEEATRSLEAGRVREGELERAKAAADDGLAATRLELEEATDRAASAERRAAEAATEIEPEPEPAPAPEPQLEPEPEPEERDVAPGPVPGGPMMINLSEATFDDLRSLGMSITQAKRVLDYRERLGGFDSIDDLDFLPGFPKVFLARVKDSLTL